MENSTRLYFALVYSMLSAILTVCMHTLKLHHMHTDVCALLLHTAEKSATLTQFVYIRYYCTTCTQMTGRLTQVVRGEPRPSTRFSMRLVERGGD
jgi:hypothetical protein